MSDTSDPANPDPKSPGSAAGSPPGGQQPPPPPPPPPPPSDYSAGAEGPDEAALRGDYRSRGEDFRARAEEATARVRGAAESAQEQTRVHMESARAIISESNDRAITIAAYALYLAIGVTGGLSALAGVILAYVKQDTLDPVLASHLKFQIRTFWIGLVAGLVGLVLTIVFIGVLILIALAIWWLIRNVVGLIRLLEGKPINDPKTWVV